MHASRTGDLRLASKPRYCIGALLALLAVTNATGQTATYTYDSLGRLQSVSYADGSSITYTYDIAGNRTTQLAVPPTSSVPEPPALIMPAYQFVTTGCASGQGCTQVSGGSGGSGYVSWLAAITGPPAHHFELQQALNSANFTSNLSIVFSGTQPLWVPQSLIGANPANWYYIRVRACNASNQCSTWTEVSIWEVCSQQCGGSS